MICAEANPGNFLSNENDIDLATLANRLSDEKELPYILQTVQL